MPQLDLLTYQVQFFWLFCAFGLVYFFSIFFFLPRFYNLLKTRKAWNISAHITKLKNLVVDSPVGWLSLSKKNFNFLTLLAGSQFQFLKFISGFFTFLNLYSKKYLFLISFFSKREFLKFF